MMTIVFRYHKRLALRRAQGVLFSKQGTNSQPDTKYFPLALSHLDLKGLLDRDRFITDDVHRSDDISVFC